MFNVMIVCPKTGELIPTGIAVNSRSSFENSQFKKNSVKCPKCGKNHIWSKKDVQLEKS